MISKRDTDIKALRPELKGIQESASSDAEKFQNATLRPVLKIQNNLLLVVFKEYLHKRKSVFYDLSRAKKMAYIEHAVQKDQRFKSFLTGMIAGHFTQSEWDAYRQDEAELRRRMATMLVKRIQDQWDQL